MNAEPKARPLEHWQDLADALKENIVKEVTVFIHGDFTQAYPMLAHPELEECTNLQALHHYKYLAFQFEEAPSDEKADMYALELLEDYRTADGQFILRVSNVDADGDISIHNTTYMVQRVEIRMYSDGQVDLHVYTYDSKQEGGADGLGD